MQPTRRLRKPLLTGAALAAALCGFAHAETTVYSDNFDGGTGPLHDTTPDTTTGAAKWVASTDWNANGDAAAAGSETGLNDDCAFLAFIPTTGKVYTLTATLATPSPSGTLWAAIGFTADKVIDTSFYRASDNNASPWILYRANTNLDSFLGPALGGPADEGNTAGPITLTIKLDTTTTLWSVEWFVNGGSVRTASFTSNPTINYVGLGREDGGGANFSSFSLTVVPEPSAALLGGLGFLALLRRRRR